MITIDQWQTLVSRYEQVKATKYSTTLIDNDMYAIQSLIKENGIQILDSVEDEIHFIENKISEFQSNKTSLVEKEKTIYDENRCIMVFRSGFGGKESESWTSILFKYYADFFDTKKVKIGIIDINQTNSGIKNVTIELESKNIYGKMLKEQGVHRLVRNSPYNANQKRETSYCTIEIIPFIPLIETDIKDKDIRIDVFKSNGAGGQNVQKNSTAIRIVHLPTNISVTCQNERSLLQNKERAFSILSERIKELNLMNNENNIQQIKSQNIKLIKPSRTFNFCEKYIKDHVTNQTVYNINFDKFSLSKLA